MSYIDRRSSADRDGDHIASARLHKLVKASVKQDKEQWLRRAVYGCSWTAVQQARRKQVRKYPARLLNNAGEVVDTALRAETFAEHLETVQWAVRPSLACEPRPPLGPEIPVSTEPFVREEVVSVLRKLRKGKAAGHDDIPPDFWKVCVDSEVLLDWLLFFSNEVWEQKRVPDS